MDVLEGALREEKDVNVYTWILAVRFVLPGNSAAPTAVTVNATQRTIQLWVARFNEYGIKSLYPDTG